MAKRPASLSPETARVLTPLARRKPVAAALGEFRPARLNRLGSPRLNPLRVVGRALAWARTLTGLWIVWKWSRVRGRESEERTAERVVRSLLRMGPVSAKVASEFSYRIDLLPAPLAFELANASDRMEPIPISEVVAEVEAALGGPLHEHFAAFDPEPFGSRAIRSTYRARLKDGRDVVVRVRRPGIRERLGEELAALTLLFGLAELLTLVRPGFFRYLKSETSQILLDEADFRLERRAQTLFRRRARRDRIRWASAPRPIKGYVGEAALVAEYLEGYTLAEVIAAVERQDQALLAELRSQGIHPRRLARRLMHLSWWELHECLSFHAGPTPMDVMVLPGGQLRMVHFADSSTTSRHNRELVREIFTRLDQDDVTGATAAMVALLAPLPFIDTHTFSKQIEARLWQEHFALRDKEAWWWERTTAGIWAALLDVTREHNVLVHLDVIRIIRSSIMFGAMAARLWPRLDPLAEFRRYQSGADRRKVRRWTRETARRTEGDPVPSMQAAAIDTLSLVDRALFYARRFVGSVPVANLAMPRKAAYAATVLISLFGLGLGTATAGALGILLKGALQGRTPTLADAVQSAVQSPVWLSLVAVFTVIAVRRLIFRLSDTDKD